MGLPSQIKFETSYGRALADSNVVAGHLEACEKSYYRHWILNTDWVRGRGFAERERDADARLE